MQTLAFTVFGLRNTWVLMATSHIGHTPLRKAGPEPRTVDRLQSVVIQATSELEVEGNGEPRVGCSVAHVLSCAVPALVSGSQREVCSLGAQ